MNYKYRMEAIFEIKLRAKEPINGYKKGETVIIVNPIFDRKMGVAFFPIDSNFEIVYYRQFVGLKASDKDIFDGDILSDGQDEYQIWIEEGKMLIGGENKQWDAFVSNYAHKVSKMKIVGNVYDERKEALNHE